MCAIRPFAAAYAPNPACAGGQGGEALARPIAGKPLQPAERRQGVVAPATTRRAAGPGDAPSAAIVQQAQGAREPPLAVTGPLAVTQGAGHPGRWRHLQAKPPPPCTPHTDCDQINAGGALLATTESACCLHATLPQSCMQAHHRPVPQL